MGKMYSVLVNVAVEKNNKILLVQRAMEEKHEPGKWCIPGGKLEFTGNFFEALEETAKREVREETGIEIKDDLVFLCNNTFNHRVDNQAVISIVFLARYRSGKAEPLEDTMSVSWAKRDELKDYDFPHPNVKRYVTCAFDYIENS